MPEVIIYRNSAYINQLKIKKLIFALRPIVAEALSVFVEDELTENDVVVREYQHGPNDVGTAGLEIKITAQHLEAREANVTERTKQIVDKIIALRIFEKFKFEKGQNNICVMLTPSAFVEF